LIADIVAFDAKTVFFVCFTYILEDLLVFPLCLEGTIGGCTS